jgi:hypothetical protein
MIDMVFMFNLNLTMSAYMDLVIEKNGDIILLVIIERKMETS